MRALNFYVGQVVGNAVSLVILALLIRAWVRHRHSSFLLLSLAVACGLIESASIYVATYAINQGQYPSDLWALISTSLLLAQMALGLLGIVSLLREFGKLSSASARSGGA